jgi:hypothetical protein
MTPAQLRDRMIGALVPARFASAGLFDCPLCGGKGGSSRGGLRQQASELPVQFRMFPPLRAAGGGRRDGAAGA